MQNTVPNNGYFINRPIFSDSDYGDRKLSKEKELNDTMSINVNTAPSDFTKSLMKGAK